MMNEFFDRRVALAKNEGPNPNGTTAVNLLPLIGTTLSHFKITAKLGEGGMGEVWLAEDLELKRQVALKLLPPAMALDPQRLERFRREAEAVAALNHPNIVTLYAIESAGTETGRFKGLESEGTAGTETGRFKGSESEGTAGTETGRFKGAEPLHFLVMELVEGESLDQALPRGGWPLAKVLDVALAIAEALATAHEKGIVHRDLKPANIMLTGEGRIKVLDFRSGQVGVGRAGAACKLGRRRWRRSPKRAW